MWNPKQTLTLMTLFFLLSSSVPSTLQFKFLRKLKPTLVRVTNQLSTNASLHIHCQDKKLDLGDVIVQHNESWSFVAKNNFWGLTDFCCSFVFLGQTKLFDIYVENRDLDYCWRNCNWRINEMGPCLVNPGGRPYIECYSWN